MNKLNELLKEVSEAIDQYDTIELTNGMNGYPEPYAGVLLEASTPSDVTSLNALRDRLEELLTAAIEEIEDNYDEGEDEDLLSDLRDVHISFCQAEWQNGWDFAKPYDLYSIETTRREDLYTCTVVRDIRDLEYVRYFESCAEELGVLDKLEYLSEKLDIEIIDTIHTDEAQEIEVNEVLVEVLYQDDKDYPEWDTEIFDMQTEADAWLDEELVNVPARYDNRNYAVGLRLFGFTADLNDRLNAGGGIVSQREFENIKFIGLNIPKY